MKKIIKIISMVLIISFISVGVNNKSSISLGVDPGITHSVM